LIAQAIAEAAILLSDGLHMHFTRLKSRDAATSDDRVT
jgi:hypothetical protein